jgi:HAD superfamily hydrolase (TIGR01509 family)
MLKRTPQIAAVIFDMDGLMFDTERISVEAWQRAAGVCGCEIPEPLLLETIGRDLHDTRILFDQTLGSSLDFERARDLCLQYVAEIIAERGVPLKDGLLPLLSALSAQAIPKAVATSTERSRALPLLEQAQIASEFDVIVCGDEVRTGKPAPDIFLLTADRLGIAPEQCYVLEDSDNGVMAAARAGMRPLLVPDLKPPSDQTRKLAERIFPNLETAATYLSTIFAIH